MNLEQRVHELEREVNELKEIADIRYEEIRNILKYLRKKYPQDFVPDGQFKPGLI